MSKEDNARVLAPPAQPGKTVIDYSTTQISADLPAPPDAESVQYADQLKRLDVDATGTPDDLAAYYRATLSSAGWEATTENRIANGVESFLIFRNSQKEMLTLDMRDLRAEKKTRLSLKHQSAAEVATYLGLGQLHRSCELLKPDRLAIASPSLSRE